MGTINPTWNDSATPLIAPQILERGTFDPDNAAYGPKRETLDLTGEIGASLICAIGRTHTTAITGNLYVIVRRMYLNKALSVPSPQIVYPSLTAVASVVAVQNTTLASGITLIPMTADPTAVAVANSIICFTGSTQPSALTQGITVAAEWKRAAKSYSAAATSGGTSIWLDAPTANPRLASEATTNQAEIIGPLWLAGGAQYEVIFDYSAATAGEPYIIACWFQKYQEDTTA